jgi:hypothetical protein
MTRRLPCPVAGGRAFGGGRGGVGVCLGRGLMTCWFFYAAAGVPGVPGRAAGARDRSKTLTALAGAEPVAGAQHRSVQRLQFFVSESRWDPERVNARRLELLRADRRPPRTLAGCW